MTAAERKRQVAKELAAPASERGPRWRYQSENISGNLHDAARYVTEFHPEWDVVTMHSVGGYNTVIVWRESI